jgi:hypothetical protein
MNISLEIEEKKQAANSPLAGNDKKQKLSNADNSPNHKGHRWGTYASVTADTPGQIDTEERDSQQKADRSIFKTPKPEGAFRDEIVVEVNTIDGSDFKSTVTTREAIKTIFTEALGFEKSALDSLTIGYSKGRIITFKLKNQFDIDKLSSIEKFEFRRESKNRNGDTVISVLGCRIRGIRQQRGPNSQQFIPYTDEGYRWVKIEGAEYRLDRDQIGDWLNLWGDLVSDIAEDTVETDGDDIDCDYEIGNGTYSVMMRLRSVLPQFLPMFGKRIRLFYRGIAKKSSNCFGPHARGSCNRQKVT